MVVSDCNTLFTFLCVCLIPGLLLEREEERENAEEKDLNDSYLVRYVKTRPESESFKEARECRGRGSE